MGTLQNKIDQLRVLEDEFKKERELIIEAIQDTIRGIGQNPAITPISKHIFTIKASEIMGTSWSPRFHDWEVQAEYLLEALSHYDVNKWIEKIKEWTNHRSKESTYTGVGVKGKDRLLGGGNTTLILNKKFLQKVCEKL